MSKPRAHVRRQFFALGCFFVGGVVMYVNLVRQLFTWSAILLALLLMLIVLTSACAAFAFYMATTDYPSDLPEGER